MLRPLNQRSRRANRELSKPRERWPRKSRSTPGLSRDFRLFGVEDPGDGHATAGDQGHGSRIPKEPDAHQRGAAALPVLCARIHDPGNPALASPGATSEIRTVRRHPPSRAEVR